MTSIALVIDDNLMNVEVLSMLLEREGLAVQAMSATRQVEESLDRPSKPAVVFLDLEFPIGDGFDLFQTLKAHPIMQGVPIVAYSVHTSEIDRARLQGFNGFLGKPINSARFPQNLRAILAGQQVWEV